MEKKTIRGVNWTERGREIKDMVKTLMLLKKIPNESLNSYCGH
jgi:hypothetical protein